jgi:hypothetical protein
MIINIDITTSMEDSNGKSLPAILMHVQGRQAVAGPGMTASFEANPGSGIMDLNDLSY